MAPSMHVRLRTALAVPIAAGALLAGAGAAAAADPVPGVDWVAKTTPSPASSWRGVAYGNGRWVAVGGSGAVMTSADGDSWSQLAGAPAGSWYDVHYANGMFVAVSDCSSNAVMTSADGLAWTVRATETSLGLPSCNGYFQGVTYGNGRWVVTNRLDAQGGGGNDMVTSTDGVAWTLSSRLPPLSGGTDEQADIAFGNGTFVIVYEDGTTNAIATSPDGLTWTERVTPAGTGGSWQDVTFGNGRFVSVGWSGNVMYSTDNGQTWTQSSAASNTDWNSVTYGSGLFVAVADTGTGNRVMTSPDGIIWTSRVSAANNGWENVAWAFGRFVAVADSGTDRVMTSGILKLTEKLTVEKKGDGGGSVASSPAGIDCGSTCVADLGSGADITLTATPAADSTFTGWSGGCTGTATTCTVTLNAATTVTAEFTKKAASPATTPATATIARATGNRYAVTATVRTTGPGRVVMTGTVNGKAAFRPGTRLFTTASSATIRSALNARTRALLRTRDVRVKITVRFVASDGRITTSTRTVLIKKVRVGPVPVTG